MPRMHRVKEFTIDRSTWVHGGNTSKNGTGDSALLNQQGYSCCVGHYAKACNVPNEALYGVSYLDTTCTRGWKLSQAQVPTSIMRDFTHPMGYFSMMTLSARHLKWSIIVYSINDLNKEQWRELPDFFDDDWREMILTQLFAEKGIKVTFTGWTPHLNKPLGVE